ncbi:MAG: HINT domain-containing protein, partial [Nitrospiraceae bacterium]|nr:HINT domain-containing protein [Nitrospiraceae bacterium]MBX9841258.1 HINT domain-containing protein [Xanthobacteraceae bacterium]
LVLREIEEVFVTIGMIWHLHIGGEVVRTTDEHPWWVEGKGWTETMLLQPGDRIVGRDGTSVAVEEVYDTGEVETVYNFRVAEHHTYFVGDATWQFDLWAHNACRSKIKDDPGLVRYAEQAGKSHQESIDRVTTQLARGNLNPGIGTRPVFGDISEARSRDGARVYFRTTGAGDVEILAKSDKSNQDAVINRLRRLYGS